MFNMARNQVSDLNLCDTPLVGQFTSTLLWVESLLGAAGIRDHHLESRSSQYTLQWGDTSSGHFFTIHPLPTFFSIFWPASG